MALILTYAVLIFFAAVSFIGYLGLARRRNNQEEVSYAIGLSLGAVTAVALIAVLAQHGLIGLAP